MTITSRKFFDGLWLVLLGLILAAIYTIAVALAIVWEGHR